MLWYCVRMLNRRALNNSLKKGKEVNYVLKVSWLICLNLKIFRLVIFFWLVLTDNWLLFRSLAHDNVRKYLDVSNCLTIASASYENCFQYAGVPLTELINENALSLATNHSIALLKLLLTVPAVSVPGLILCITKFIDERKWCC